MPQKIMDKIRYKVVLLPGLTSTGLLHSKIIHYKPKQWNKPNEPTKKGGCGSGGLWTSNTKSQAKSIQKYIKEKHNFDSVIFLCIINRVLYSSSCRTKTDKLFLIDEVI